MGNASANDCAWGQLFDKYNILHYIERDGYFNISADQIKKVREPRLMAKFDHILNLPKLFFENKLAILPISRGDYVISHFDAYHRFEADTDNVPVKKVSLPTHIQSLDVCNITSETIALNCAFASGIVDDFLEDSEIYSTVSGRMSSGAFSFDIRDIKTGNYSNLSVNNSQIEIDAAYEGVSTLALFEAKRDLSNDFLIRQLYYPFRLWQSRVTKTVKPIFLIYSNGIYRLYLYNFDNPYNYNSIRLVKQMKYSIEDATISVADIQEILNTTQIAPEPQIPFPQADKFERVINLCEILSTRKLTRVEVTEQYDFDIRQTNYYTDAARYLGLLDKGRIQGTPIYSISKLGRRILNYGYKERQLSYCRIILSHKPFNMTLKQYFANGVMPSISEIVNIMKLSGLYNVGSDNTFSRRSSTIKGWINWIVSLIND